MACARSDFYTPNRSGQAHLLEPRDNLQHMLASIPLTDDVRAAVKDGRIGRRRRPSRRAGASS